MNVLVTGHNGYIGSILTKLLLERGYTVTGIDVDFYKGCNLYTSFQKIKQIKKDIRKIKAEELDDIDVIIHLAGLSNDPLCNFDEDITYQINYHATVRLAKLAKRKRVKRFVFASSQSVYGKVEGDKKVYETEQLSPITAYGKSKELAEKEISKLADKIFTPVFLRPSTVYGLSPKHRVDIVLNNLIGWAFTTGEIKILSDGMPWRPVIHVEDIANAFIAASVAPRNIVYNQVFNVGEKESLRIRDMAELIKRILPGSKITYVNNYGPDERSYRIDSSKFSEMLKDHYQQKWEIKKGILDIYDGYKKFELTFDEFTGDKYIRLNRLKKLRNENKLDKELYWISK